MAAGQPLRPGPRLEPLPRRPALARSARHHDPGAGRRALIPDPHRPSAPSSAAARFWHANLALLALLLSLYVAFREPIATGFDRLPGDWLDGFIQLAIMQHWDNVLHGAARWATTFYFYPWPDTLAYNDGYLIDGLLYTPFHRLGLDPFMAETAAFAALRAIGFIFTLLFARQALRLAFAPALLGATLFTIASNAFLQSVHGQLFAVGLCPLFVWLLWHALTALRARRDAAALAWGAAAAILFGALLLTSFYVAWFTGLALLLALPAALALGPIRPFLRWPLLSLAAFAAAAALPCVLLYLPQAHQSGGHGYGEVRSYLLSILDLVHVGERNWLFGALDAWLNHLLRPDLPDYGAHLVGFPPLLLLFAIAGAVLAWRERRVGPLPAAMSLATAAALLLSLQIGGHSLWFGVYAAVPGARAVRVVSRIAVVLALPITLVAMVAFARLRRRSVAALAAMLLFAEQISGQELAGLDHRAERAFLASVPDAPPSCRVFYVRNTVPRHDSGTWIDTLYPHNTDAMLIAELRRLPTINGISTFNPPDWSFDRPATTGYLRDVDLYLRTHDLADVSCGLDLATLAWTAGPPAVPPAPPLAVATLHRFGDSAMDANLNAGWEDSGPVGRWTIARRASLSLTLPPDAVGRALLLDLEGLPMVWSKRRTSPLTLSANGTAVTTWRPLPAVQHLRATIPPDLITGPTLTLQLQVAEPHSPSEMGQSPDQRTLGFFVTSIRLDPIAP